jgi:hypothetical protein
MARLHRSTARTGSRSPAALCGSNKPITHPLGTIKARVGATHFLMKTLPRVAPEMALHVLAYNVTRVMNIMGHPAAYGAIETRKAGPIRQGDFRPAPRAFLHTKTVSATPGLFLTAAVLSVTSAADLISVGEQRCWRYRVSWELRQSRCYAGTCSRSPRGQLRRDLLHCALPPL